MDYLYDTNLTSEQRQHLHEKHYLKAGLSVCGGNKTQAAKYLNITVRTLRLWIKRHPELEELYKKKEVEFRKELSEISKLRKEIRDRYDNYEKREKNKPNLMEAKIECLLDKTWFRQLEDKEKNEVLARYQRNYQ